MAERTEVYSTCDICKKEVNESLRNLINGKGWERYHFSTDFESGAHSGISERDLVMCGKCHRKASSAHYLAFWMKRIIEKVSP